MLDPTNSVVIILSAVGILIGLGITAVLIFLVSSGKKE